MKIKELKEILNKYDENKEFYLCLNKDNVIDILKSNCYIYYFDLVEMFDHERLTHIVHKLILNFK